MQQRELPTILLFGAPGVGKGTQGHILGRIPGFFHLACGEVFRSIDISSPEGQEIYQYTSHGQLVPDDLTMRIWAKALDNQIAAGAYKPHEDMLVLDGIPRNVNQAKILENHVKILRVVHLVCSDEESMIHRMKRRAIKENRADDANESVIRHRFDVYHAESAPVLNFYRDELISDVEAIATPAEVLHDVLQVLIPVQNEAFPR